MEHPEPSGGGEPVPDRLQQLALAQSVRETLEVELASSLTALSRLSAGEFGLIELLTRVAGLAVTAVPGADGAGLTLLDPDGADLIVVSSEFVREIEDIQYGLGEGPCISAAAAGRTMRSGSLGVDVRWPRFWPRAGRLGVHSVLSLPLLTPNGVLGAMNVYAHGKDVFDARAEDLGEMFAEHAAVLVHHARILSQVSRLATRLRTALTSRPVIDQAIGILSSRSGDTAADAFRRLTTMTVAVEVPKLRPDPQLAGCAGLRSRGKDANPGPDRQQRAGSAVSSVV